MGEIYHPPHKSLVDFISNLSNLLDSVTREGTIVYLMGDYNINSLKYPQNHYALDLMHTLVSHSFIPLASRPTRASTRVLTLTIFSLMIYQPYYSLRW